MLVNLCFYKLKFVRQISAPIMTVQQQAVRFGLDFQAIYKKRPFC